MKRNYRTAYNALKKLGCPVFERSDYPDRFLISTEYPESDQWANYYANPAAWGYENTSPLLDKILSKSGLFAEWENPACLIICEI